ncbi:MAG: hypothetical protein RR846_08100 [Oscillospiraceae bacterium]
MNASFIIGFAVVVVIMYLGDIVSIKSKGKIPSLLVVALCFLAGYWTIFPKDILDVSLINSVKQITMLLILIQVGAMFDLKQLKKEWRVVATTMAAIVGILVVAGVVGSLVFGRDAAIVAIPPLTGGGMATIIMSDAAEAKGLSELAMMATIVYIMQGFVGFPLTTFFLRKEGVTLVDNFRNNSATLAATAKKEAVAQTATSKKKFIDKVPDEYKTTAYYLAKMSLVALVVGIINMYTGKYVNISIIMIAAGVLVNHFGFMEKDPLKKANSMGILMLALTASFMRYFADSTPKQVLSLIIPVASFLALGTIGIMLFSIPVGKKCGYSKNLSIAIGLNCFLGFPHNFVITNEVVRSVTKTPEEAEYVTGILMPKMIIGSVVSVSVVSALVAGLLAPFLV